MGSLHGNDISTELSTGEEFVIPTPIFPNKALAVHKAREQLRTSGLAEEIAATLQDIEMLEKANSPGTAGQITRHKTTSNFSTMSIPVSTMVWSWSASNGTSSMLFLSLPI